MIISFYVSFWSRKTLVLPYIILEEMKQGLGRIITWFSKFCFSAHLFPSFFFSYFLYNIFYLFIIQSGYWIMRAIFDILRSSHGRHKETSERKTTLQCIFISIDMLEKTHWFTLHANYTCAFKSHFKITVIILIAIFTWEASRDLNVVFRKVQTYYS